MQNLETLKNKGQESVSNLISRGKEQSDEVKMWGVTAAAGVGGAVAVAAVAKGVLAVMSTLATPAVALTVGALGGGMLGWSWMQQQQDAATSADTGAEAGIGDVALAEAITEAAAAEPYAAADGADTASAEGRA